LDDIGDFGAQVMTLSYLALALAIVLLLTGVAGTAFTFRTLVQRRAEHGHNIETQMWHGISVPVHPFQFAELMIDTEHRHKGLSRLFYHVAYYVTLGVATIATMAVSLVQLFSK
jgi:hypothetical protein